MDWRRKLAKWLYPEIFEPVPGAVALLAEHKKAKDAELAAIRQRGVMREINLHRSRKRPRTKFQKRWPHGKHKG